jgi:hypothetical protein
MQQVAGPTTATDDSSPAAALLHYHLSTSSVSSCPPPALPSDQQDSQKPLLIIPQPKPRLSQVRLNLADELANNVARGPETVPDPIVHAH